MLEVKGEKNLESRGANSFFKSGPSLEGIHCPGNRRTYSLCNMVEY